MMRMTFERASRQGGLLPPLLLETDNGIPEKRQILYRQQHCGTVHETDGKREEELTVL